MSFYWDLKAHYCVTARVILDNVLNIKTVLTRNRHVPVLFSQ